jgi:hypothetical protein
MSKVKYQRKLATNLVENSFLYEQSGLATGVTVTMTRPQIGKFLEPVMKKNGVGFELTPIIKDALLGKPGMKFVQSKTGHKEVTVDITGL